jgi:hypothetical protein
MDTVTFETVETPAEAPAEAVEAPAAAVEAVEAPAAAPVDASPYFTAYKHYTAALETSAAVEVIVANNAANHLVETDHWIEILATSAERAERATLRAEKAMEEIKAANDAIERAKARIDAAVTDAAASVKTAERAKGAAENAERLISDYIAKRAEILAKFEAKKSAPPAATVSDSETATAEAVDAAIAAPPAKRGRPRKADTAAPPSKGEITKKIMEKAEIEDADIALIASLEIMED